MLIVFWATKKFIIKYKNITTYIMTMHLVNLAKSSKSIFEFLFVPVITVFLKLKGGPMPPP